MVAKKANIDILPLLVWAFILILVLAVFGFMFVRVSEDRIAEPITADGIIDWEAGFIASTIPQYVIDGMFLRDYLRTEKLSDEQKQLLVAEFENYYQRLEVFEASSRDSGFGRDFSRRFGIDNHRQDYYISLFLLQGDDILVCLSNSVILDRTAGGATLSAPTLCSRSLFKKARVHLPDLAGLPVTDIVAELETHYSTGSVGYTVFPTEGEPYFLGVVVTT